MPTRNVLARIAVGAVTPRQRNAYLLAMSAIFWGLIAACWLTYPPENEHSVWTHTFSFYGSWDDKHNPQWWWLFSIAMVFWGAAAIPLALYHFRCLAHASRWAAGVGTALFITGAVGIGLVGVFPDAKGDVFTNWAWTVESGEGSGAAPWRWTDVHEKAAIIAFAGYGLGIFWYAGWFAIDMLTKRRIAQAANGRTLQLAGPFSYWTIAFGAAAYFQGAWAIQYERMKHLAAETGERIGSSWSESLHTWYSFPLWENVVVYSMYIFLVWFTLALPAHEAEANSHAKRPRQM